MEGALTPLIVTRAVEIFAERFEARGYRRFELTVKLCALLGAMERAEYELYQPLAEQHRYRRQGLYALAASACEGAR